jgi:hypothetical protein
MRIFDNANQLARTVIERRLRALDSESTANPYRTEREDHSWCYYVGIDSTLTDAQIESCLGPMTQTDTDAEADDALLRKFQRRVRTHCQRIREQGTRH